ncbi:MAG: hypothetical protein J5960_02820 [Desulfovibrio sp.]|nr:hypothetical protein [Desulfovibrio sp.]
MMPDALVTGTPLGWRLLVPALLTAAVETPVFRLCGYRRARQCLWFVGVNMLSNLLLNEFLSTQADNAQYDSAVLLCEAVVVLLEFVLCRYFVGGAAKRLWLTLAACNACSYGVGLVLYRVLWG